MAIALPSGFNTAADSTGKLLFLKVLLAKNTVYLGEPVVVSYLLYHRVPVIDPQQEFAVTFPDCDVETFPAKEKFWQESVNGKSYQVVQLRKYLLIPQKAGDVRVPALSLTFKRNAPPDPDDFFGVEQVIATEVRAEEARLTVKPLPPQTDPVPFAGALGQFKIESRFEPVTGPQNLLNFTLKIWGAGNLKALNLPTPAVPAGTEIFNETQAGNHSLQNGKLQAEHAYSFQVMANYRGNYVLQPLKFAYFDLNKNRYVTYETPAYDWKVPVGPEKEITLHPSTKPEKAVAALILKSPIPGRNAGNLFGAFLGLSGLAAILYMGAYLVQAQQRRVARNPEKEASRRALSRARKAMKVLRKMSPQLPPDAFSRQLLAIFKNYLAAKYFKNSQAVTPETVPGWLAASGLPAATRERTRQFFYRQYAIRFSGQETGVQNPETQLKELSDLLQTLENCFHEKITA